MQEKRIDPNSFSYNAAMSACEKGRCGMGSGESLPSSEAVVAVKACIECMILIEINIIGSLTCTMYAVHHSSIPERMCMRKYTIQAQRHT